MAVPVMHQSSQVILVEGCMKPGFEDSQARDVNYLTLRASLGLVLIKLNFNFNFNLNFPIFLTSWIQKICITARA